MLPDLYEKLLEPMVLRKFLRIDRAGDDWFEWDSMGGPGYWNLAWTGLFNGATVRFYRIVDAEGNPLSYNGLTDMNDTEGAHHVVFIGESTIPESSEEHPLGGYIANDDRDGSEANDMARVWGDENPLKRCLNFPPTFVPST